MRPKEVPSPLPFHKVGWEEIAKPPQDLPFYHCSQEYGLHNKNANGGGMMLGWQVPVRLQGAGGLSPGGKGGERGRQQAGNKRQL